MSILSHSLLVASLAIATTSGVDVDMPINLAYDMQLAGGKLTTSFVSRLKFSLTPTANSCDLTIDGDVAKIGLSYKNDAIGFDKKVETVLPGGIDTVQSGDTTSVSFSVDQNVDYFGQVKGSFTLQKKAGQDQCCFKEWDALLQIELVVFGQKIGGSEKYKMTDFTINDVLMCPAVIARPTTITTNATSTPPPGTLRDLMSSLVKGPFFLNYVDPLIDYMGPMFSSLFTKPEPVTICTFTSATGGVYTGPCGVTDTGSLRR